VPEPGVGGAGQGLAGLAWGGDDTSRIRLLQELRRQLHHPSRPEQGMVDQPSCLPHKMPSWEPASAAFTISGTLPKPPWPEANRLAHEMLREQRRRDGTGRDRMAAKPLLRRTTVDVWLRDEKCLERLRA
jgi:hypothetical protein